MGPAPDPDNGRDAIPNHENRNMTIVCAICRRPFVPRRSTAQFCGPRCRQTAHRRADQSPIGKSRNGSRCSEGNIRSARGPSDSAGRAGRPLPPKAPGSASRRLIPLHIVPDQVWPDMWRLVFSDGRISGLLNITRAKDAVARARLASREMVESHAVGEAGAQLALSGSLKTTALPYVTT